MRRVIHSLILALAIVLMGCEEEATTSENAHLYQAWTHAFEEQENANSTRLIFRPSDSQTFAASRFRESYEFGADGSCEYLFLDPADAHHFRTGSFIYDSRTQVLEIRDANDEVYSTFLLVEVDRDRLILDRQ